MGNRLIRWTCFLYGALLMGFSAYAWAADGGGAMGWKEVALGLIGFLSISVGAYTKVQELRLSRLEHKQDTEAAEIRAKLADARELVLKEYHSKEDIREIMDTSLAPIREKMNETASSVRAVHRRLDGLKVPFHGAGGGD